MSQNSGESCESNDRKRKLEDSCADDDNKVPKLSTSLGLSLLQAYDEEEVSSEGEQEPKTSYEGTSEQTDLVSIEDPSKLVIDHDSISFSMVEEVEEETSFSISDVATDQVEETIIDQFCVVEEEEEVLEAEEDSANLKDVSVDKLNELDSDESKDKPKDELDEAKSDSDFGGDLSTKLCDASVAETIVKEIEKKTSEPMRPDFNFSIFSEDVSSTDTSGSDSKPAKKVKLNRSKFVRPTDESSNDAKRSPTVTTTPITDQICSIAPATQVKEVLAEPDNSINDSSSIISSEESQVENCIELKDKLLGEIDETHSAGKESMSNDDVCSVPQNSDDNQKVLISNEQNESVNLISALDERIDNESTNQLEVSSPTADVPVAETVSSPEYFEPQLTMDGVAEGEPLQNESLDEGTTLTTNDTCDDIIIATAEEKVATPKDENEDEAIELPVVGGDGAEMTLPEEDSEEVNIPVAETDSGRSSSEVVNECEMDLQESEIVKPHEQLCTTEGTDDDSVEPVSKHEDEIEKLSAIEVTERPDQLASKPDRVTSDEETFEDAVETIETVESETIQEPNEDTTSSQQVEKSKLEQALTGHVEATQSQPKTPSSQGVVRKGRPPKAAKRSAEEATRPAEDAKQNIKLHLSVQGDRVSIKNTQPTPETPRVKRQYRKRTPVPGELEAQQASAKEYTHRLRQRTERETPGAKKRTRKKKDQEPDSLESKPDTASSSSSTDVPEKVLPLTVAINKLPSRKRSVAGKVQPIKLKITKNSNVTIESASKYDVCLAHEEDDTNRTEVNENMVDTSKEADKTEGPPSACVEKTENLWSMPDSPHVEPFGTESVVTIAPVASERDVSPSPVSVPKPASNSQDKPKIQVTPLVDTEPVVAAPVIIVHTSESDGKSKNLTISLKADADERNSPWKIVKSPLRETTPAVASAVSVSKPVDVKSEIRKKIASVEKRKQDINVPDVEPVIEAPLETKTPVVDLPSSSSSSEPEPVQDDSEPDHPVQLVDVNSTMDASPVLESSSPTSVPKTPSAAITTTPTKLPRLPVDLFPKKRGRPTKAMVAAREAYWQQQEEIGKLKGDEVEVPGDVCISTPTESVKSSKIAKRGRKLKTERVEKKDSDDLSYDELPYDPTREAEEQKRVEEERVKKEEERERKNELRRLKAKERSDFIKAKRLRQKMKAKERHKMAKELRRLQLEEKKKLEEQLKRLPASMGFDDDTRMSAENSQAANISFSTGLVDDDSSGAANDLSQKLKKSRMEVTDPDSKDLMVDQVAEYQWPIQGGDLYMIQEQVSNFLGVKSFKRKYPDIWRRPVDSEERAYLVDSGLVSETLCDLGITAVRSSEVLDIMCSDFPEKYEEFRRYMRDKQMKELSFKQRAWANGLGYKLLMADGSKQDMKKRAMESVANWNSALNKSRVEDRRSHMDLQTFIIHYPKQRGARMTLPTPKIGSYPVTILPGQFCDFYKEYTSTELRYLPVNTVLYGPLKQPSLAQDDASQTDSDDSSSSDDSSTTSEDTQATEETLEELDSTVLDGGDLKFGVKDSPFVGDEEPVQKGMNDDRDPLADHDPSKVLCKVCLGDEHRNKMNIPEVLISCCQCGSANHPTCLDLSLNIVPRIKSYAWQCPDCKICAQCKENADEDKMLFCDTCDQGYHIYCVGLIKVPAGNWQCKECSRLKENYGSVVDVAVRKEPLQHAVEMAC